MDPVADFLALATNSIKSGILNSIPILIAISSVIGDVNLYILTKIIYNTINN